MAAGAPLAFARIVPFGHLVGVALPGPEDAPAIEALAAALLAEERTHAETLAPARRATWIGGRVALRAALTALGLAPGPISTTPRGAPALPPGVAASISHKRALAVALAANAPADVTLGVDLEVDHAPRVDISERVLTPDERRRVAALAAPARAREVLALFSAKEAIYKALDPWLRRFVGFEEVEIGGARAAATFTPRAGEPSFEIELREEPLPGHVLMTARVHRRAG